MTLDETEISRIRFEDLSESLQELINNLVEYDELQYINFRINLSNISNRIDINSSIHVGNDIPKEIFLGKTAFFNTIESAVQLSDAYGNWVYLK